MIEINVELPPREVIESTVTINARPSIVGVTASVDANIGTPSVVVTSTGTGIEYSFDLAFHNLKGEQGVSVTGVTLIATSGLQKTYRMSFSNGTYYDYIVSDGAAGATEWGGISGVLSNQTDLQTALNDKYDASNPNGYTANVGTVTSVNNIQPVDGNVTLPMDNLPSQAGNAGKFLTTDGTDPSWAAVPFRNIGELVESLLPLTDAGLHLLDGTLINGSGIYSEFVDYIADLYNDITTKVSNVNVVGSITDNNSVISGFSLTNYTTLPLAFNPSTNPWEMVWKVTTGNDITTAQAIFGNGGLNYAIMLCIANSKFLINLSSNKTSWDIASDATGSFTVSANTTYWVKLEFTGSAYVLSYSTDGTNYTTDITATNSATIYPNTYKNGVGIHIKTGGTIFPFLGSIDLTESYIDINGARWWTGAPPVGFTDEETWQAAVTAYGSCGKFVYDAINNTVRLPKVSDILQGTTDLTALGDLVQAGLPAITHTHTRGSMNITGAISFSGIDPATHTGYAEGAFSKTNWKAAGDGHNSNHDNAGVIFAFNAANTWRGSTSNNTAVSPLFGKYNTVQPQTIKVLYYIVVATSTKTDIEVDIDEIATDLNGKADVDLLNLSDTGNIQMAKASMPSGRYIDLTLGASGTRYYAPANGWIYFQTLNTTQTGFQAIYAGSIGTESRVSIVGTACTVFLPVVERYWFDVYYDTQGTRTFRFIYAKGSESEA